MRRKSKASSTIPVLKTIPDAARDWFGNISPRHVYTMIDAGKLRRTHIGNRVFIAEDDAREMIERGRRKRRKSGNRPATASAGIAA